MSSEGCVAVWLRILFFGFNTSNVEDEDNRMCRNVETDYPKKQLHVTDERNHRMYYCVL